MVLLYILCIAYILAINFYAVLLVKSFRDKEREREREAERQKRLHAAMAANAASNAPHAVAGVGTETGTRTNSSEPIASAAKSARSVAAVPNPAPVQSERIIGKLCITGALGGAIAIYVCMFIFKFRRNDLLLMVLMPVLGVLNVYIWILLFRTGFFIRRI